MKKNGLLQTYFLTIFWKFKWRIGYGKYSSLSKINRQWRKWRALAKSLFLMDTKCWNICHWTPCLFSVESREVTIIGNMWGSIGNFLGISLLWDLTISGWSNEWINITWQCFIKSDSRYLYEYIILSEVSIKM